MSDSSGEQDQSQKTEEPTFKRLQDARKKGQVAVSRDVNNWIILFSGGLVLLVFIPSVMRGFSREFVGLMERSHQYLLTHDVLSELGYTIAIDSLMLLSWPLIVMVMAAIFSGIVQNGVVFAPESLIPKLEKISPLSGFKRLFSIRQLLEFVKGILKILLVGVVGALIISPVVNQLQGLVGESASVVLDSIDGLLFTILLVLLSVLLVIAIFDLFYQRYANRQKMMMTRQEVKEEYKNTEGDPQIKARLRQIRQERARRRMMQSLPRADVVITNPTHYAIALSYNPEEMGAPVVLAKGMGTLALRIREKSIELNIPIVENPPVARILYDTVEVDQEVPPQHYRIVAEIISYVWSLRQRRAGGAQNRAA